MKDTLFCYGTLQAREVIEGVAGMSPPSQPARLSGYGCYCILGEDYPGMVAEEGGL